MTTDDPMAAANALLEEWGFVSRSTWMKHKIGDVLEETVLFGIRGSLGHQMVVTGNSNADEWMEQHRFIGGGLAHPPYMYFYRTKAE